MNQDQAAELARLADEAHQLTDRIYKLRAKVETAGAGPIAKTDASYGVERATCYLVAIESLTRDVWAALKNASEAR